MILTYLEFDINLPSAPIFLENYSRAMQFSDSKVFIHASFLIDLFLMKPEYLLYRPSLVVAVALDLSLQIYEIVHPDKGYNNRRVGLRIIMNAQDFDPNQVQECRTHIQRYLLSEMTDTNVCLTKKYGNTEARIYLTKPILENQ